MNMCADHVGRKTLPETIVLLATIGREKQHKMKGNIQ